MKFDKSRLIGVGRGPGTRESGDYLTQLWFTQDDKSVVVATYYEDCELRLSRTESMNDMKNAAYAVSPPKL